MILCTNCRLPYPDTTVPYKCPACGGIFDMPTLPAFDPARVDPTQPGIWRYRHTFGLPDDAPTITLGEGNTPLVWADAFGKSVAFKLESLNPTGSHKDRGVALLASFLRTRGVAEAVEDSSGNAGASFAAYATRAGIKARVFIPDYASGPKRNQIAAYGAELVRILGRRSDVADAVRRAADAGAVYASHAYLPHLLPGFATLAYELVEELGQTPGTVICPAGHGILLLGLARGFENLKSAGVIARVPRLVGVQALNCAPLWAVYAHGQAGLGWVTEGETVAEGVRVSIPIRGDAVLFAIQSSQGTLLAAPEEHILLGRNELARRGFYVEPTSAIVWDALGQIIEQAPEPVVVILTGSGLKSL
ncbi:MAG: pyridoxal-phosphate dependent enzyme [Anaerolineales bacterium]|nr:pyridoxal-phosphate dependent enzyme [Anaerolineales bacterium]